MDITGLSMNLSQITLNNDVQIALMSKAMEIAEISNQNLIKMMENSVAPHLGQSIDIRL